MTNTSSFYLPELTLPDLLHRAIRNHRGLSIGFADKNGNVTIQTYEELRDKAKLIAAGLFNLGLKQGDKLIIAALSNRETVELLWGSFLLGVVPTILQPPIAFSGYSPSVVKLRNVYEQLKYPFIFLSEEVKEIAEVPFDKIQHIAGLDCAGVYPEPILQPDDLAFIQFSSGSTGDPKGIMLTHSNLMINMDAISVGLDVHPADRFGNWMPIFHDMRLIGYHITPIYSMVSQYQVETLDFVMSPCLWLTLMSQQKITISGCTNFGLALVLRHLSRSKSTCDWDLSGIKGLLNGAEPISVRIMQEFVAALTPYGFRPEAMMPVYGLAEATLAVTFAPLLKPSVVKTFDATMLDRENKAQPVDPAVSSDRLLSEVGLALNNIEIRIVKDGDEPVEDGNSGHIQLKGKSITRGYYNKPDATAAAFSGEWLCTGDIGFFFEGHLYISGRQKDIIFKNGRNYFANDLEAMACSIDEIKYGKVCFGGTTGRQSGQGLIIAFIAGIPTQLAIDIFRKLRTLLCTNLGITVDEMVLIKSNEIPKTSSGKLQRYKLMQQYRNKEFHNRTIRVDDLLKETKQPE